MNNESSVSGGPVSVDVDVCLTGKDEKFCVSCNYGDHRIKSYKNGSFMDYRVEVDNSIYRDFRLVGFDELGKGCGDVVPKKCCSNIECSRVYYGYYHCRKKSCPDCWERWSMDEVERIKARLLCSESKQVHNGKRLVHIILSPSCHNRDLSREELNKVMGDGYKYLILKGVVGGCMILHPYRALGDAKKAASKAGKKTWEWIRDHQMPYVWYKLGLHFHVIAFIDHMKPPEEGEDYIYKVITDGKNKPRNLLPRGKKTNLIGQLGKYVLSHTVTCKGTRKFESIRWFGSCGKNKLKVSDEEKAELKFYEAKDLLCSECGAPLVNFWVWVRRYFYDVCRGGIPPPNSMDEICDIVYKCWKLPEDYKNRMIDC